MVDSAPRKRKADKEELQTPAAIKRRAHAERRNAKLNYQQTVAGCRPPTRIRTCGHMCTYSPALIAKLRMYYCKLPKVDQRSFLAPGVRCTLDKKRLNESASLSNVKLHVNFRLEKPDILMGRLSVALRDGTRLPTPALSETLPMCQKDL